ncbi:uncharacterized protein GO595_008787 [Histomonas meleagridis]|nr:hypothetical protein GO595_008787 [Histomonas meleagridis]
MNEVYTAIDNVVLQTLRVSAISMNLELQSGLATTCSNIAVNYDSLLKELRSRFMLSGDWDGQSPKYRENIKNAIEETQKIAQKALEIAEEEAKAQNAVNAKFTNVLNPLTQVKSSLETYNDKVKTMKSSISREYATNMLGIGITLCDSVNHVVLHAKAHPSSEESVDSYLSLTEEVTEQMKLLLDASTKITSQEKKVEEPETLVIDRMKGLNGIGEKFAKPHNNESPEAKALREGVVVICKGANALANSAETALNNKREQRKKQEEAAKKGGAVVRVGTTKESLLKRLELESRVIRARIILEKSEKNLAELG